MASRIIYNLFTVFFICYILGCSTSQNDYRPYYHVELEDNNGTCVLLVRSGFAFEANDSDNLQLKKKLNLSYPCAFTIEPHGTDPESYMIHELNNAIVYMVVGGISKTENKRIYGIDKTISCGTQQQAVMIKNINGSLQVDLSPLFLGDFCNRDLEYQWMYEYAKAKPIDASGVLRSGGFKPMPEAK